MYKFSSQIHGSCIYKSIVLKRTKYRLITDKNKHTQNIKLTHLMLLIIKIQCQVLLSQITKETHPSEVIDNRTQASQHKHNSHSSYKTQTHLKLWHPM